MKKTQKKGSIFKIEPVLLYLYMFNIYLDPRETCINKGVERSYKHHFVAHINIILSHKNIEISIVCLEYVFLSGFDIFEEN